MNTKGMASKLISVLLVAVMIVTSVSVSFAETGQSSDVTTPAAQDVDNTSGAEDSSTSGSDVDSQVSDTDTEDSDVTSTDGVTGNEENTGDEEVVEETTENGIVLFAEEGYTITFNKNYYGGGAAPAAITTDEDGNFTFPDKGSMERRGYTFMGWGQRQDTGHCDTSDGSIAKDTAHYSIYEPGETARVSRDTTYYAVWATSESAQYFIRLDGTVPREPGDYDTSLYTDAVGTGKTVKYNTFYANSNVADNGVESHLGTQPTTAEIMSACNAKAGSIRFSDGSSYERCSTTAEFESKYYVIWYVVKVASSIHVDGSLLKKSLYNVTYEPNAKTGEYTGTVPAAKQYAAGVQVTVESSDLKRDGYIFMGWESSVDGKTYNVGEKFTMPAGNVVLKAIWVREGNLSYTVNYLDQSTGEAIHDPKVVGDKYFGDEVSEEAIDIEGYTKVAPVSAEITISKGENVINFYYTKRTDLSYTVNYYEKDSTTKVADSKTVNNQTYGALVTEEAIDVTGYNNVGPTSQSINIAVEDNVINFYYEKRTDLSYTVNYLEQGTNNVLSDAKTVDKQTFGASVTETAIDITGYDVVGSASQTFEIKASGNEITFYYTKKKNLSYVVRYLEKDTNDVLRAPKTEGNKTFQESVTETAPDINGYNKVDPTSVTITISADNSKNEIIFYYEKRTDLSYTVNYLEQGTNKVLAKAKTVNNQTYKSSVTEEAIVIAGYNKVAPTSRTITIEVEGNVINFYYTKRTDLEYTVNYLEYGTNAVLHDPKKVENQVLDATATESAIDIAGYDKKAPTSVTITIKADRNIINFYYEKRTDLTYTVNYLEYGTNSVLHEPKTVTDQTYNSQATESAIDIDGYNKYGDTVKTITIGASEANVINFYYTKRTDLSYTVRYLEKDTNEVLATEKSIDNQTFGATVEEDAIAIDGYKLDSEAKQSITIGLDSSKNVITFFYTKRTDLSYKVRYLEAKTEKVLAAEEVVDHQTFGANVTENAKSITGYNVVGESQKSLVVSANINSNVITFYYAKKNDLAYVVNYLDKDTMAPVATAKTETGQTFEASITENAIDVEGYNKVAPTSATITISSDNSKNVITFYYTKRTDLSYTINYYKDSKSDTNKIGDTVTVGKQTYQAEVTLDSDKINARKPSTDYYDGQVSPEKLTIKVSGNNFDVVYKKKPAMSISASGYEGSYDGTAHSGTVTSDAKKGETVYTYYQIIGDQKKKLDSAPSVTDVQRDSEGNVVTLHYMVEASNAEYSTPEAAYFDIKITPLTIKVNNMFMTTYNGLVQTFTIEPAADQTENGVLEGENLQLFDATISGKDAATYNTVSDYSWNVVKADGITDSTVNYNIEVSAELEIQKSSPDMNVRLDIESYKGVYDGKSHERVAIFEAPEGIMADTEIQYSSDGENWTTEVPSIKNVGKEKYFVRAYNENFAESEYPMKEYTLEVTPRKIVVYAEAEYMYDGKEKVLNITADDIINRDIEDEGLVDGEFLSLENAQISGTEPGVYTEVSDYRATVVRFYNNPAEDIPVEMAVDDLAEIEFTTDNYNIQVAGKLTIGSSEADNPLVNGGKGTKTGDAAPVGILFGLLALAACGGGFAVFGRRKREE